MARACYCRGRYPHWAYHSRDGCGRDAERFDRARGREGESLWGGSA